MSVALKRETRGRAQESELLLRVFSTSFSIARFPGQILLDLSRPQSCPVYVDCPFLVAIACYENW